MAGARAREIDFKTPSGLVTRKPFSGLPHHTLSYLSFSLITAMLAIRIANRSIYTPSILNTSKRSLPPLPPKILPHPSEVLGIRLRVPLGENLPFSLVDVALILVVAFALGGVDGLPSRDVVLRGAGVSTTGVGTERLGGEGPCCWGFVAGVLSFD